MLSSTFINTLLKSKVINSNNNLLKFKGIISETISNAYAYFAQS